MKSYFSYIFVMLIFLNCSGNSNILKEHKNIKYFSAFEFDKYGIPKVGNEIELTKLPDTSDYYLVNYTASGPESIYIIKRVDKKKNLLAPFKVIYEWTGKGFKYGYVSSKGIIEKSSEIGNAIIEPIPENSPGMTLRVPLFILSAVPGYIIGTTIFIASGTTGFLIGLKESGPEAYNSFKKIGEDEGIILGKYIFYYDNRKRIKKLAHYSAPPDNEVLSDTVFYYRKDSSIPYRSVNHSFVDEKKRVVFEQQ